MGKMYNVSSSPHVRSKTSTQTLMLDVIIAMIPACVFGIWHFGMNAALVLCATVAACVLSEFLYEKGMKKPVTIKDLSAVVTGMILAMNMPPQIPLWMVDSDGTAYTIGHAAQSELQIITDGTFRIPLPTHPQ